MLSVGRMTDQQVDQPRSSNHRFHIGTDSAESGTIQSGNHSATAVKSSSQWVERASRRGAGRNTGITVKGCYEH